MLSHLHHKQQQQQQQIYQEQQRSLAILIVTSVNRGDDNDEASAKASSLSLLERLTPLKTIMLLVASETERREGLNDSSALSTATVVIGAAVTDPYLSSGRPLPQITSPSDLSDLLVEHRPGALLLLVGYTVPITEMASYTTTTTATTKNPSQEKTDGGRGHIILDDPEYYSVLQRYGLERTGKNRSTTSSSSNNNNSININNKTSTKDLLVHILGPTECTNTTNTMSGEGHLQVLSQMLDDYDLSDVNTDDHDASSIHATIALNHWLWTYTGGWRNNTFG
jgi:hypothetical protein